jgi:8-oxo-dGTP pyrophosphatase MutT (NUDIX family)
MKRNYLLYQLDSYEASDAAEEEMKQHMVRFVRSHPDCFERTLEVGHVTGSAWITDESGSQVLMVHHAKLDRWLQPGGHCDGDHDVLGVALREAWEETGATVTPFRKGIFDVDIHVIPARKQEPAHLHYDVRYWLKADPAQRLLLTAESKDLRWVPIDEVVALTDEESVLRMVRKTKQTA